jgi:hypothetical protein
LTRFFQAGPPWHRREGSGSRTEAWGISPAQKGSQNHFWTGRQGCCIISDKNNLINNICAGLWIKLVIQQILWYHARAFRKDVVFGFKLKKSGSNYPMGTGLNRLSHNLRFTPGTDRFNIWPRDDSRWKSPRGRHHRGFFFLFITHGTMARGIFCLFELRSFCRIPHLPEKEARLWSGTRNLRGRCRRFFSVWS